MCDKCVEIDKTIKRYQALAANQTDRQFLDEVQQMIDEKLAEKAALHPEQTK